MTMSNPFERFAEIERAYIAALDGRAPEFVSACELLSAILEAVPDATTREIVDALRWTAHKDRRAADQLERAADRLEHEETESTVNEVVRGRPRY